jgi:hypothetical protein
MIAPLMRPAQKSKKFGARIRPRPWTRLGAVPTGDVYAYRGQSWFANLVERADFGRNNTAPIVFMYF